MPRAPSRGDRAARWIENYCRYPHGPDRGQRGVLTDAQRNVARRIYDRPTEGEERLKTMTLPAVQMDEESMVDLVSHWIDVVADKMTSEASRAHLRDGIRELLRAGTLPTMRVITAARAGHQDADLALRKLIAEYIDRREELPTTLAGYAQEALFRGPTSYPPGRNLADTWVRDIGIAVLVALAAARFDLPATRNPASRRPSAASLVHRAFGRRGQNLGERRINTIFGQHQRLSASIPPI